MFLMTIPLVRDFVALFPDTLEFRDRMRRKPFWKAMVGFLVAYLIFSLGVLGLGHVLMPHVRHNGNLFITIGIFLLNLFWLVSALPLLSAQARRLHDARLSAGWLFLWLIPYLGWLVLLVLFLFPSKPALRPGFSAPPR